jgi:hypothetical protein
MPTLNSEATLRQAVNSIVEQTYTNIELVVVDGGSTDRTLEILDEYDDGEGLKVVHGAPGAGMAAHLNLGLDNCDGAFIARMDADDISWDWRIAAQHSFLSEHSDVDLVGSGVRLFGNASGECLSPLSPDDIRDAYLTNNPFFHPTIMFRRKLVDDGVLRYDEAFKGDEDYELWGRLVSSVKCANMNCVTMSYRMHASNSQRHPRQLAHKKVALERFCRAEGIDDPELIEALCEFQASAFVTPAMHRKLRNYGLAAEAFNASKPERSMPKLGWIHDAIVQQPTYPDFIKWYNHAKGWKIGA